MIQLESTCLFRNCSGRFVCRISTVNASMNNSPSRKENNVMTSLVSTKNPSIFVEGNMKTHNGVMMEIVHGNGSSKGRSLLHPIIESQSNSKCQETNQQCRLDDKARIFSSNDTSKTLVGSSEPLLKKQRIACELRKLEATLASLQNGQHEHFLEKLVKLEKMRDGIKESAKRDLNAREAVTIKLYKYECEEAENEYDVNKEKLKEKLLEEIDQAIKRIKCARDGVEEAKERMTTRNLRSSRNRDPEQDKTTVSLNGAKSRKRQNSASHILQKVLEENDISEDLKQMQQGWNEDLSTWRAEEVSGTIHVVREHLFYYGMILEQGDELEVRNHSSRDVFQGLISSIFPTEIFLLLEDGSQIRIRLCDLRSGKFSVSIIKDSSDEDE